MTSPSVTYLDDYRGRAIAGARAAVSALAKLDVRALITGSLARGSFGVHSDVDLLIIACPGTLKYTIESVVEDSLNGVPFDVVYLDELPAWRAARFTDGAVDASELG